MSTGFRLFLLIFAAFLAVWVYQLRTDDLALLLGDKPLLVRQEAPSVPFQSPVEGVIGPESAEAVLTLRGVRVRQTAASGDRSSERDDRRTPLWSLHADESFSSLEGSFEPEVVEDLADHERAPDEPDFPVPEEVEVLPVEPASEPEVVDSTEERSPDNAEGAQPREDRQEAPEAYTVRRGDNLWKIAENLLGSGTRSREILKANKDMLPDPNLLHPGTVLRIPTR